MLNKGTYIIAAVVCDKILRRMQAHQSKKASSQAAQPDSQIYRVLSSGTQLQRPGLLALGHVRVWCQQAVACGISGDERWSNSPLRRQTSARALECLATSQRLPHLLTQCGPGVALPHFRHPVPLHRHQSLPQDEQQREFALAPRGAVREGRQQRQPFGEGGDRFVMGIAPDGIVCRLLE